MDITENTTVSHGIYSPTSMMSYVSTAQSIIDKTKDIPNGAYILGELVADKTDKAQEKLMACGRIPTRGSIVEVSAAMIVSNALLVASVTNEKIPEKDLLLLKALIKGNQIEDLLKYLVE